MTIAESFAGSNGTWGTEWSLTTSSAGPDSNTTDGLYAPFLDCSAIARGDLYVLRAYEMVVGGGTQRECGEWLINNQQSEPLVTIPPMMLCHSWDFTLQRLVGTDRTITYSVRGSTGGISEVISASPTVTTSEHFLASNSTSKTKQTTAGFYQVFLDLNAVAKGDEFLFQCDEEARAADTVEQLVFNRPLRLGTPVVTCTETLLLMNGWEFSLDKIAGTDRAIPYSIRKAA